MNRAEALDYARRWTQAWNERNVEAVLDHFEDDIVFSSPKAVVAVGLPTVQGKSALRNYWLTALRPVKSFRFTLQRAIWDPETSELAIIYDRDVDGHRDRAAEVLHFGPSGRVVGGEVLYGVVP
jgi:SnoaL-like domain